MDYSEDLTERALAALEREVPVDSVVWAVMSEVVLRETVVTLKALPKGE